MENHSLLASRDVIDDYLENVREELNIPGLVLGIIQGGTILDARERGRVALEFDVPADVNGIFELASLTKPFTASATMLLVQDGELSLDDEVGSLLKGRHAGGCLEHWSGITVRHLLNHTCGLPNRFEWRPEAGDGSQTWLLNYSTDDLFEFATKTHPEFAPGEKFLYSDTGYFLLGVIIEEVSGQDYRQFLKHAFFDKLDMASTDIRDPRTVVKGLAQAYAWDEGTNSLGRDRLRDVREELTPHYGIISNVADLAKWEEELGRHDILAESSLEQMWQPTMLNDGRESAYGLGWMVGMLDDKKMVDHSGITGTYYMRVPEDQFALVLLTNRSWIRHDILRKISADIIQHYNDGSLDIMRGNNVGKAA